MEYTSTFFLFLEFKNTDTDKENLLSYCDAPCNEILKCGDLCSGTCGQCWQGRLHMSCRNKCGNTLICGHRLGYRRVQLTSVYCFRMKFLLKHKMNKNFQANILKL